MTEGAITSVVTMWVRAVIAVACLGLVVSSPSHRRSGSQVSRPGWKDLVSEYNRDEDSNYQQKPSAQAPLQAIPFELPLGSRGSSLPFIVLPIPVSMLPGDNTRAAECKVTPEPEHPQIDVRSGPPSIGHAAANYNDVPLKPEAQPLLESEKEPSYPSYINVDRLDESVSPPEVLPSVSSQEILEQFLAQKPQAPHLPPVLLSVYDSSERIPHPEEEDVQVNNFIEETPTASPIKNNLPFQQNVVQNGKKRKPTQPPRPNFSRSLMIRGELSVPAADYTEPYTAWWDAASGSSKVNFHGGSTSTFRTMMAGKRLQRLEMRVDRSGEHTVRRCARASSLVNGPLDVTHPALPDIDLFNFVGYEPDGRVERWQHTVIGRDGELGAVRGEALTLQHDLLLIRDTDDTATPILYTVSVSSSILGPNADGYEHRYLDVRSDTQDPEFFVPDTSDLCDNMKMLNASVPDHFARLEPLREFIIHERDPRYKAAIEVFKDKYNRRYIDSTEEAVRTTLLMQHKRFISSGNRIGATFEMEVNFLGDRLDVEVAQLSGVQLEQENTRAELFPHSRSMLRAESAQLPDRFDWRPKGGVSPVQNQDGCSSCWAFAVSGAVEGALFARTGRLVPLSQQSLVDCAHPFGGKGCGATWPSHAYDYVQNRGLPALDDYPKYKAKVGQCEEKSVRPVTRISGHVNVTENSETALKVAISKHAPTVVIVDCKTKSFVFYKHGVLYDDRCGKTRPRLNHAVLAVGWGGRKEKYFILKNSWSEAWGERGYVRVHARSNTCGVLTRPSYPRLEERDVVRKRGRQTNKDVQ